MDEEVIQLSEKAIQEFDLPYVPEAVELAGMTDVRIMEILNQVAPNPPEDPEEQKELMEALILMILRENYRLILKDFLH